jgi:hypothetical protein
MPASGLAGKIGPSNGHTARIVDRLTVASIARWPCAVGAPSSDPLRSRSADVSTTLRAWGHNCSSRSTPDPNTRILQPGCPPIGRQAPLRPHAQRQQVADWGLEEAALAATRSKDTYLATQYARLRPRRGHKKALGAVKHSIIVACWHMLSTGEIYNDLGGDYFQRRTPAERPSASSPSEAPMS